MIKEDIDEAMQYSPLAVDVFLQKVQTTWQQNFKEVSTSLKKIETIDTTPTNRVMTLKDKEMILSYCQALIKKAKKAS